MAQATILAAGTSQVSSTDVTVAVGSSAKVGIFVASGTLPSDCRFEVREDTPGADLAPVILDPSQPSINITAAGTYRVARIYTGAAGVSVGVFSET